MNATKNLLLASLLCFFNSAFAQVSITTDNSAPDSKAMLDIKSTDKGVLIPRMTTSERSAFKSTLSAAHKGMLVFDTDAVSFWYYNGTTFIEIGKSLSAGTGISISGSNIIDNTGDTNAADDITTGTAAAGDLQGTYPAPTIAPNAVTNVKIGSGAATNGQVLTANGSGGTTWAGAAGGT
jgi:hypothetical protein